MKVSTHLTKPFRPVVLWLVASLAMAAYLLTACFGGPESLHACTVGVLIALSVTMGVWLLVVSLKWLSSQDLFSPLIAFPLAYTLWFGFASLNLLGDSDPLPYGYFVLGFVFYWLGARLARKRTDEPAISNPSHFSNRWDPTMFWTVMGGLGLLMVGSYVHIVSNMGIPALSPMAGELRGGLLHYGPSQAVLFSSTWTVFVFLCVHLWSGERSRKERWLCYGTMVIISLMMLSLGSRGLLFVPVLTALIARHYARSRFTLGRLSLAGVLLFIPLSLYGYVRDTMLSRGSLAIGGTLMAWLFPFLYAYIYIWQPVATFRDVTHVIPSQVPYQHGALTLSPLATLLPGHHEMSDMFFKNLLGSDFVGGGQPATLLGPLYGDFGAIGIAVGMLLFGILMSRLYAWMQRDGTLLGVVIYAWAMQNALFSLFGSLFTYITVLWIPILWCFLHLLMRRTEGRTGVRTGPRKPAPSSGGGFSPAMTSPEG